MNHAFGSLSKMGRIVQLLNTFNADTQTHALTLLDGITLKANTK